MGRKTLALSCILLATSFLGMNAQVGIGTESPKASAILDVTSTNQGVLFPRVTLLSKTDATTIASPEKGLIVFNIPGTTSPFQVEGFLYWNGTEWRRLTDGNTEIPAIDLLLGGTASLSPATYRQGVNYVGSLRVPYTGGNGGSYTGGQSFTTVNGLTCTLQPGTLNIGNGDLIFNVTGTPVNGSPITTTFNDIAFMGVAAGPITVGRADARIETRTAIGAMTEVGDGSGAEFVVNTMDNRYSLRFFVPNGVDLNETDIQLRHNGLVTPSDQYETLIIMHQYTWGESLQSDNETPEWLEYSTAGVSHNDWQVPGTAITVPNSNWHLAITNGWKKHGDPQVYSNGRPEYRILVFMPTDNTSRVYRYTFFFGIPGITGNTAPYSRFADTKCWVFAEEISSIE